MTRTNMSLSLSFLENKKKSRINQGQLTKHLSLTNMRFEACTIKLFTAVIISIL